MDRDSCDRMGRNRARGTGRDDKFVFTSLDKVYCQQFSPSSVTICVRITHVCMPTHVHAHHTHRLLSCSLALSLSLSVSYTHTHTHTHKDTHTHTHTYTHVCI